MEQGYLAKEAADVVVVGSGAAGLPAALTAAENGAKRVVLLEKRKVFGGNSMFAAGIFGADTEPQRRNFIDCSMDEIYEKTLAWHRYDMIDPLVLRAYLKKSSEDIDWLAGKGVGFEVGTNSRGNFRQTPCFHVIKTPNGGAGRYNFVVDTLKKACREAGVEMLRNAACKKLLKDEEGRICGVLAEVAGEERSIPARSVIIATGGFCGNDELMHKYFPYYDEKIYEGHMVKHSGDGIRLVEEAGGALYDRAGMVREAVKNYAKAKYHMSMFYTMRQPNSMMVNARGRRFISEEALAVYGWVNALQLQPNQEGYALFDQNMIEDVEKHSWRMGNSIGAVKGAPSFTDRLSSTFREMSDEGYGVRVSDDWAGIAAFVGAEPAALEASVARYNAFCASGYDDDYLKQHKYLEPLSRPPYYAVRFSINMVDTLGPVRVNDRMEVLNKDGGAVPGLYAAGVIAGGWSSADYCSSYMFGSCIGFSVASGRIAAENAAEYAKRSI